MKRQANKHLCIQCSKRKALFRSPSNGQFKADRDHKLCRQCYKSLKDSIYVLFTSFNRSRQVAVVYSVNLA